MVLNMCIFRIFGENAGKVWSRSLLVMLAFLEFFGLVSIKFRQVVLEQGLTSSRVEIVRLVLV